MIWMRADLQHQLHITEKREHHNRLAQKHLQKLDFIFYSDVVFIAFVLKSILSFPCTCRSRKEIHVLFCLEWMKTDNYSTYTVCKSWLVKGLKKELVFWLANQTSSFQILLAQQENLLVLASAVCRLQSLKMIILHPLSSLHECVSPGCSGQLRWAKSQ